MILCLSVLALAALASSGHAGVLNGSFETGLGSWSTIGDVSQSSVFSTDGSNSARLTPSVSIGTIESTLGLTAGTIDSLTPDGLNGSKKPTDGAAIYQTFSIGVGDVISFDFSYVDAESNNNWNDTAIAIIDGASGSLMDLILGSSLATDSTSGSGTFTATQANSNATLAFVVFNQGDTAVDPVLYIDNVAGGEIPEPATLGLMILGLAGIGLTRKKRTCLV